MPEVSIVIVCMNRPDMLFPCLDSIRAHTTVSYETLVVTYVFSKENLEALKARYPWVTPVPSDELRGFSENNNLALKQAKGRYCLILNDDTLLTMPLIDSLVATIESLPEDAAAVSPCIRFADGRIQTCGRSPWTPWRYAKHYLHLVSEGGVPSKTVASRPLPLTSSAGPSLLSGRGWPEVPEGTPPSETVFQTFTLNGACFLIKTDAFREAGWFDERFFFTPEDIALGHKLNEMGYTVWANPEVSVTHLAGGSVSAMEQAIKPTRVRGSMIFYCEPLWLKCSIWCVEAFRLIKHTVIPSEASVSHKNTARNVMHSVFSKETPKEIFKRFRL